MSLYDAGYSRPTGALQMCLPKAKQVPRLHLTSGLTATHQKHLVRTQKEP